MAGISDKINAFVDHEWKEIDNNSLVRAHHDKDLKLADVPTLIIGIGGTGIAATRTVKEKVERHYHPNVAEKLEYLFIDTDEASVSGLKGSDTLVIQNADTAVLLREYKEGHSNIMLPKEITEWLDPKLSPFRVMNGAAGIRQAGRLILFLNINRVYHTLEQKLKNVSVNYDLQKTKIKVHIFTGLGGGTGSGMFVDISYLIRHICPNCEIQGFTFMPDVSCLKTGLHDVHRRNIKRNTFAALKELEQLMTLELYGEKFEQTYPGNLAKISTSFPIFDFCVLVGSMQDGRKALRSEQTVYEHVAEYLLLELHQKEKGTFDFESFKSNLCVEVSKNYFFTKYVSVDADAIYLPTNHYYSCWLNDIFKLICNGLTASHEARFGIKQEVLSDINKSWNEVKDGIHWFSSNRRYKEVEQTIQKHFEKRKSLNDVPPKSLDAKLELLGEQAKNINDKIQMDIEKSTLGAGGPFARIKRRRVNKCYKAVYLSNDSYRSDVERFVKYADSFLPLMQAIHSKCQKYVDTAFPDTTFGFAKDAFRKLQEQEYYDKSIRDAAGAIVNDFMRWPELWLGKERFSYGECLSDHVAKLVGEAFEKSGCMSIQTVLEAYSPEGVSAIQEQFVKQVLDKLHAAPLWPVRPGVISSTLPDYNSVKILAHSNEQMIKDWADVWCSQTQDKVSAFPNQMLDRVALGVYASGYAQRYYESADELALEYKNAASHTGLQLYDGDRRSWNRPFSPFFSYDWSDPVDINDPDDKKDQEEARIYRQVFDKARETMQVGGSKTIIHYDDNKRIFVCQPSAADVPHPIGNIEGELNDENYVRLVCEIFIRMRLLREKVKTAIQAASTEEKTDGKQ